MHETQIIDPHLAEEILDRYADNPLLAALQPCDARDLLVGSLMLRSPADATVYLEEWKHPIFHYLAEYLSVTAPEDIVIPLLVLEGTLNYYFETGDATPPLTGSLEAPLLTYYVPYAYGTRVVLPQAASSPGSVGIIFDPDHLKEIATRNPGFYDLFLKDRNRLIAMLLKWSQIHATFSHANRLARFLYALLPDACLDIETISMTQNDIAQTLGFSRATISKAISTLSDKGIIETGHGEIQVGTRALKEYVRSH